MKLQITIETDSPLEDVIKTLVKHFTERDTWIGHESKLPIDLEKRFAEAFPKQNPSSDDK